MTLPPEIRMSVTLKYPVDIPPFYIGSAYATLDSNDPMLIHLLTEVDEDIIESILSHETLHSVLLLRVDADTSFKLDTAPWRQATHRLFKPMGREQGKLLYRQLLSKNRDGLT